MPRNYIDFIDPFTTSGIDLASLLDVNSAALLSNHTGATPQPAYIRVGGLWVDDVTSPTEKDLYIYVGSPAPANPFLGSILIATMNDAGEIVFNGLDDVGGVVIFETLLANPPAAPEEFNFWYTTDTKEFFFWSLTQGNVWVPVGGATTIYEQASTSPPATPVSGEWWYQTDSRLMLFRDAGNVSWIEASPTIVYENLSSNPPANPFPNQFWRQQDTGDFFVRDDSNGTWLPIAGPRTSNDSDLITFLPVGAGAPPVVSGEIRIAPANINLPNGMVKINPGGFIPPSLMSFTTLQFIGVFELTADPTPAPAAASPGDFYLTINTFSPGTPVEVGSVGSGEFADTGDAIVQGNPGSNPLSGDWLAVPSTNVTIGSKVQYDFSVPPVFISGSNVTAALESVDIHLQTVAAHINNTVIHFQLTAVRPGVAGAALDGLVIENAFIGIEAGIVPIQAHVADPTLHFLINDVGLGGAETWSALKISGDIAIVQNNLNVHAGLLVHTLAVSPGIAGHPPDSLEIWGVLNADVAGLAAHVADATIHFIDAVGAAPNAVGWARDGAGAWVDIIIPPSGVPEAPSDSTSYARINAIWSNTPNFQLITCATTINAVGVITGAAVNSTGVMTGGTGVNATTGNVYAAAGQVIGQTGVTANSGDVTAITGHINAVAGTVFGLDVVATSDETLKTNIHRITNPIMRLFKLQGIFYDWKNGLGSSGGITAQAANKAGLRGAVHTKEDGKLGLNYNVVTGLLVEVMKWSLIKDVIVVASLAYLIIDKVL